MNSFQLDFRLAGGLFVSSLILFWLAAPAYPFVLIIAWFLVLLVGFSVVHACYVLFALRWTEDFSNDHPMKGSVLTHKLSVSNESFFPLQSLIFHVSMHTEGTISLTLSLQANETKRFEQNLICKHRGIYKVGLQSAFCSDTLGLIPMTLFREGRTFYVYPHIIDIHAEPYALGSEADRGIYESGTIPEAGTISNLDAYRPGMDTKTMDQLRFASTGQIFLRKPDLREDPSMVLVLDLGHIEAASEPEDVLIDTVFTLANHAIKTGRSFTILAWVSELIVLQGSDRASLDRAWKRSFELLFTPEAPEVYQLLTVLSASGWVSGTSCYILSCRYPAWFLEQLDKGQTSQWHLLSFWDALGTNEKKRLSAANAGSPKNISLISTLDDLHTLALKKQLVP